MSGLLSSLQLGSAERTLSANRAGMVPVRRGGASGCEGVWGESARSLHNGATGAPRSNANIAPQSDASFPHPSPHLGL